MIEYSEKLALMVELNKLKTPQEILEHVIDKYDFEGAQLNVTIKPLFIAGAIRAIDLCNAKPKKKGKK